MAICEQRVENGGFYIHDPRGRSFSVFPPKIKTYLDQQPHGLSSLRQEAATKALIRDLCAALAGEVSESMVTLTIDWKKGVIVNIETSST